MSYGFARDIKVLPNEVRDYYSSTEGTANTTIDLWNSLRVIGLDWHIFNRGAAAITVLLDGTHAVTVPIGGDRGFDNVKFSVIAVTATDAYTLMVAGVKR